MAAAWCFVGLLAAVLLPGVHGVEVGWGAGIAEHECCCEHGEEPGPRGAPREEHHHEDGCPVCQVIHLAGAGGLPVFGCEVNVAGAAVRRAAIAARAEPALAQPMPQVTLRGPPGF